MEKYCKKCGRVFDELNFKLCPYCGSELSTRYGRQPIPRKLRHEVFKRDGYRCRECGASKDETSLEIDHIVPVAKGGTNDIDNLQTLCRECNRMKHTDEWIGGETDLEVAQNELIILEENLQNAKTSLKNTTNEEEILDFKFIVKKLEKEQIPNVKNKIDKLIQKEKNHEKKLKLQQEKNKNNERLFKKIYVEIDYDVLLELPNHFSLSERSLEDNLRKLVNEYDEQEIYAAIPLVKKEIEIKNQNRKISDNLISKHIEEKVLLQYCKENSIEISSEKDFIDYAGNLPYNKYNKLINSLELFNLQCMDKWDLYNKYKHLRQESLMLLCKHESIEFNSVHDVVYYFTSRYTEEQILEFIKIEKDKANN